MNKVTKLGEQVSITSSEGGFAVTPQTLNDIVEFAKFMSLSNAGIPSYLRGSAPDCAAITMQALKWGFDPFSVAQKSYKVKDVLAYEAQLIAAVINARSGIKGRLKYHFEGEGASLVCTVTGTLDGEECVYTSPPVGNITTKNSPLWKTDPQQQLGYYSARNWARRHCPEVILGAYDRDEAEEFRGPDNARDITPQPSVMQRLRAAQATQEPTGQQEGFDASFVHSETETALNGEILTDNTQSGSSPSSEPVNAEASPLASAASDDAPSSPSSDAPLAERALLIRYARDVLPMAAQNGLSIEALKETDKEWAPGIKTLSKSGIEKARAISDSSRAILRDPALLDGILEHYAEMLDCSVEELGGAA
jgi:hypothetical protein